VCGSVWQCVAVRTAVCGSALYDIYILRIHIYIYYIYVYILCVCKVAHNIYWYARIGAVGLSPVFLAY
jgi:hypothetical protein